MTKINNLKIAEKYWIDNSTEEDFLFELFPNDPTRLRRSIKFPGALASLAFGSYKGMGGEVVDNDSSVWLGMITSDSQGHGGKLLDELTLSFARLKLSIIGEPAPLKPLNWDKDRHFDFNQETLICWYMKHGFKIIQSGTTNRVVHTPLPSSLDATFTLK